MSGCVCHTRAGVGKFEPKKNPPSGGFFLFDFGFLVDHMLPYFGIIFLGLHLLGMKPLVLGRRVKVSSAGTRNKSDFLSHELILWRLDALTLSTKIGQDLFDAVLVDDPQALV